MIGQDQCGGGASEGQLVDMWVPYTAILILFGVLVQVRNIEE